LLSTVASFTIACPFAEDGLTWYGSLPLNPLNRLSALVVVLLTGIGSEPLAMFGGQTTPSFFRRSHDAVIRVYDGAGSVVETHEHAGEFEE
jgi:hypothetical protein